MISYMIYIYVYIMWVLKIYMWIFKKYIDIIYLVNSVKNDILAISFE